MNSYICVLMFYGFLVVFSLEIFSPNSLFLESTASNDSVNGSLMHDDGKEGKAKLFTEFVGNDFYTDDNFLDAQQYASSTFYECCNRNYGYEERYPECLSYVCQYGLEADYLRSALLTKCPVNDDAFIQHYFQCINEAVDNEACCLDMGIDRNCCSFMKFLPSGSSYPVSDFAICYDVLRAATYCPVLNF